MRNEEITIRSIQHYMYCPHRWGLLEIDKAWAENVFVTKANLMHERVHNPDRNYTARGRKGIYICSGTTMIWMNIIFMESQIVWSVKNQKMGSMFFMTVRDMSFVS